MRKDVRRGKENRNGRRKEEEKRERENRLHKTRALIIDKNLTRAVSGHMVPPRMEEKFHLPPVLTLVALYVSRWHTVMLPFSHKQYRSIFTRCIMRPPRFLLTPKYPSGRRFVRFHSSYT